MNNLILLNYLYKMEVKTISYTVEDVGRHVKATKKKHTWLFKLDDKLQRITLFVSILTARKKILFNGKQIYYTNSLLAVFQYTFTIGGNTISLLQIGDKYELRINN